MKRYRLKEFFSTMKVPLNKVTAIYIDDENRSLFSTYTEKDCDFNKYVNLFKDDDYLIFSDNGDYVIDINSIIEDYGEYYIEVNFPKFNSYEYSLDEDESTEILKDIYDECESEEEFIERITSLDWCVGVSLIIIEPSIIDKQEAAYNPTNIHSEIDGYLLSDYVNDENGIIDPLCVFYAEDQDKMFDYISLRKKLYTSTTPIIDGTIYADNTVTYYTDEFGVYTIIDSEDEDEDDQQTKDDNRDV